MATSVLLVGGLLTIVAPVLAKADARRQIHNPYCSVPTYQVPELAGHARATMHKDEGPAVYVSNASASDPAYKNFLLAHECCHHSRGHVKRFFRLAARGGLVVIPTRDRIRFELDADCCAAKALARSNDRTAIDAAKRAMSDYGSSPTGPGYPAGKARAALITRCAARQ